MKKGGELERKKDEIEKRGGTASGKDSHKQTAGFSSQARFLNKLGVQDTGARGEGGKKTGRGGTGRLLQNHTRKTRSPNTEFPPPRDRTAGEAEIASKAKKDLWFLEDGH